MDAGIHWHVNYDRFHQHFRDQVGACTCIISIPTGSPFQAQWAPSSLILSFLLSFSSSNAEQRPGNEARLVQRPGNEARLVQRPGNETRLMQEPGNELGS